MTVTTTVGYTSPVLFPGARVAGKIFINYRRGENLRDAQHLATLLSRRFGDKRVFIDVRGIDGGDRWLTTLERQVAASDAMVSVIGPGWIDLKDEDGNRRLDNPTDFVRFEIAQALQRDIPILPVLLDGAPMPRIGQLPQDMMALTQYQAMPLRTMSIVQDADAIGQRLRVLLEKRSRRAVPTWAAALGLAVALMVGVSAGPFVLGRLGLLAPLPIGDLQRQLDAAKTDVATERATAARLGPALLERDQARSNLANASQKIGDLQKSLDAVRADLTKVSNEADRLKGAVLERDQARSDARAAGALASDRQQQIDAAKREADAARRDLEAMKRQADSLRRELEEVKKQEAEPRRQGQGVGQNLSAGRVFRDQLTDGQPCSMCPEMVVVPNGGFLMGSPSDEPGRHNITESPQITVRIAQPFAVARIATTFDQWDACVADGGCNGYRPPDSGWGRSTRPVIRVSWDQAQDYVTWLSRKTGKRYRLLSETEREYVTRAGTTSPYWWGSTITTSQANYDGSFTLGGGPRGEYRQKTVPADTFSPNPWGLFNVHGNVWEWTEDCWSESHQGNPANGAARGGSCQERVTRGGSHFNGPAVLRAASRVGFFANTQSPAVGFRVARSE